MERSSGKEKLSTQTVHTKSLYLWDESKTILFRDVTHTGRVTLDDRCEVVDIHSSKVLQDSTLDRGKCEDSDVILTLVWDGTESENGYYYSCELKSPENIPISHIHDMCQNNYRKLQWLCQKLFKSYKAKLARVSLNPVTFLMMHKSTQTFDVMQHDKLKLLEIFSDLFSLNDGHQLDLSWNREGSEILPLQKTLGKDIQEKETSARLEMLEQGMQSNEDIFTAHYQEQKAHNDNFMKVIEKLVKEISDVKSAIPQLTFSPEVKRQSRHEETDMEKNSLSTYPTVCQTQMATVGYVRRAISESPSPQPQLDRPEDTFDQQDQTVPTSTSRSATQIHSYNTSTPVHSYINHLATGNTSDDEIHLCSQDFASMQRNAYQEESNTRSKSVQFSVPETSSPKRSTASNPWTGYSSVEAERFLQGIGVERNERLMETIGFALVDDAQMPPRAKCLDTILCLDSSSSMGQQGFEDMKRVACQLIDGIEDIAEHYDIEENIAVVAFGGRSRIEHYLSNDYGSVRDAIEHLHFGGRSPLFEALLVSLCAYQGRGGSLNISGVHKIQPRLIVITDGIPSDEKDETTMDVDKADHNVVARLIKLMGRFDMRDKHRFSYPRPVIWIPVGNANVDLMRSLARLGGGELVESQNIAKLCKYQRIQETIGKIFAYITKGMCHDTGDLTDDIKVLIDAFSGDLGQEEKTEVLDTVQAKLEGKHGYDCPDDDPCAFENILELDDSNLPPLGTRVVRGPHWKWDNQDTDGAGTVINHHIDEKNWIWVLWDNGNHNRYRFGHVDCYDVEEVKDQPRINHSDMMIDIGCEVTRGPNWEERYQDQDGGAGGVGVVIRKNKSGVVKVRWRLTHQICTYRFGKDGQLDLLIRDPVDILKELTAVPWHSPNPIGHSPELKDSQGSKTEEWSADSRWMWQWQDEKDQWHLYPEEDIQKMEIAYGRRPNGSCLIRRCGVRYLETFGKRKNEKFTIFIKIFERNPNLSLAKSSGRASICASCRVMFQEGIERGVDQDSTSRIKIRRKRMSENDIVVMRSLHYT